MINYEKASRVNPVDKAPTMKRMPMVTRFIRYRERERERNGNYSLLCSIGGELLVNLV